MWWPRCAPPVAPSWTAARCRCPTRSRPSAGTPCRSGCTRRSPPTSTLRSPPASDARSAEAPRAPRNGRAHVSSMPPSPFWRRGHRRVRDRGGPSRAVSQVTGPCSRVTECHRLGGCLGCGSSLQNGPGHALTTIPGGHAEVISDDLSPLQVTYLTSDNTETVASLPQVVHSCPGSVRQLSQVVPRRSTELSTERFG